MKNKINTMAMAFAAAMLIMATGLMIGNVDAASITYGSIRGSTQTLADMGDGTHARVITGRTQYAVWHGASGLTVTTRYVLLDLSDTTNYPHTEVTDLILTGSHACVSADASSSVWDVALGLVTAIDGSGATLRLFNGQRNNSVVPGDDLTITYPLGGLNTDDLMAADTAVAAITLLTDLDSPAGTVNAAVGDIVVLITEVTGTASATWSAHVDYWTK